MLINVCFLHSGGVSVQLYFMENLYDFTILRHLTGTLGSVQFGGKSARPVSEIWVIVHFTNVDTETQNGYVTFPRINSDLVVGLELEFRVCDT